LNEILYIKCRQKGFSPKHVCEVGVYLPETSNILGFIKDGVKSTLVEPLPECIAAINNAFGNLNNVKLHPVAVSDTPGELKLFLAESSSFAADLTSSPALKNDNYSIKTANTLTVKSVTFDTIDDGTIDLISIDTEGSEWFVLKHMVSRPAVISVELKTKHYVNPFIKEIQMWMDSNGYEIWYIEKSDTVYIKKGFFKLTFFEKLNKAIKQ
jgi:FkbM family methyltransferase